MTLTVQKMRLARRPRPDKARRYDSTDSLSDSGSEESSSGEEVESGVEDCSARTPLPPRRHSAISSSQASTTDRSASPSQSRSPEPAPPWNARRASVLSHPHSVQHGAQEHGWRSPLEGGEDLEMRFFILDNSGSTRKHDGSLLVSDGEGLRAMDADRWGETSDIALEHAEWNLRHGVRSQFLLLNPPCPQRPQEGRDFATVDPHAPQRTEQLAHLRSFLNKAGPCGNTPLTSRLRQLRRRVEEGAVHVGNGTASSGLTSSTNSSLFRSHREDRIKHLALTIVTDGLPTGGDSKVSTACDKEAFAAELQAWASAFDCRPVVRLTTEDSAAVAYYRRLASSASGPPVAAVANLKCEAQRARRNGWLAYSPQLQRLREAGAVESALDRLVEAPLTLFEAHEVLEWLFRGPGDAPLPRDPEQLCHAVERALPRMPAVYNCRLGRMTPPVDLRAMRRALGAEPKKRLALPQRLVRAVACKAGF